MFVNTFLKKYSLFFCFIGQLVNNIHCAVNIRVFAEFLNKKDLSFYQVFFIQYRQIHAFRFSKDAKEKAKNAMILTITTLAPEGSSRA